MQRNCRQCRREWGGGVKGSRYKLPASGNPEKLCHQGPHTLLGALTVVA